MSVQTGHRRRVPGVSFEHRAPRRADALPRMDVAVFVGFAASGPLHTPVPVEDPAEFAAVFAEDLYLAWDARRGQATYANLAPAVRAFFRNGGRRCWVVRVAGAEASSNLFPVPGLVEVKDGAFKPAVATARSEGAWSNALRVGASLVTRALRVRGPLILETGPGAPELAVDLDLDASDAVVEGDLLRLAFAEEGSEVLLPVAGAARRDRRAGG